MPYDEIESVEFARQGGGVVSSRTFDLVVRMKNEAEHQFRCVWVEVLKKKKLLKQGGGVVCFAPFTWWSACRTN